MNRPQESQENFRQRSGRSRFGWNNQSQGQASDPGDHKGYYKALEVQPNASQQEISAAYRYFSKPFQLALHAFLVLSLCAANESSPDKLRHA